MDTQTIRRCGWPMPHSAPGQAWLAIVQRPTDEAFTDAFTKDVVLDTSVFSRSIVGPADVRRFFEASRAMYDAIRFTRETSAGARTCLEWEGKVPGGRTSPERRSSASTPTALSKGIQLYHRPYEQVVAYSAELGRRLKGKLDPSIVPATA